MRLTAGQIRTVIKEIICESTLGRSYDEWLDLVSQVSGVDIFDIDDTQALRAYYGNIPIDDFAAIVSRTQYEDHN